MKGTSVQLKIIHQAIESVLCREPIHEGGQRHWLERGVSLAKSSLEPNSS
jgi:hypothetical protein